MQTVACSHMEQIGNVKSPLRHECYECVRVGGRWHSLRTCQSCGVTLCCDSSPHRHATQHFRATGHPVIASAETGEHWLYCYTHDAMAEYKLPGEAQIAE